MDRTQSAPAAVPIGRSISATYNGTINLLQRSITNVPMWQPSHDQSTSDYMYYSEPASIRKQPTLQSIDETSTFTNNSVVEYTPGEFVSKCIEPSRSPSFPLAHYPEMRQLQAQLTPNLQWNSSMDGSISPSTPSTALATPVTQSSNDMSRQGSFNPQFFDQYSMLRVPSDSSSICPPILSEDGSFSYVESKSISACADTSHFLDFTGPPNETFLSPAHVNSSASALESSEHKSYLVEDMQRSASSSSESDASHVSASSISSRQSRREREINAVAASRKIAPKAIENNDSARSASSNATMVRIRSEDGSSKDVGLLTKTPYIRPQHPKIMCHQCNERPNGFRGTHELDRHIARAHAPSRKGFVCVDASVDKKFLANCKHCRNQKAYGAYYNAAAHLRRAHFHPRKRGPKGKRDEKRGGIGGGDDPTMDVLKQFWIREVEVAEPKPSSSPSESASDDADANYEASYEYMDNSYPAQVAHEIPNLVDPNQFDDLSMFMNGTDPIFDPSSAQFAAAYNDANNFQFDAYMPQ